MKATLKTLIATTLLSGAVVAGSASAFDGRGNPGFGRYDGPQTQYQQADRYQRPDFRFNDERSARYIDQMQAQQRQRIQQGIRSGELTPREAQRLMAEQQQIERMQRRYMADNRLNPFERQRLMAELEDASRNIWREKHDAQARNDFRPPWFAYR
ncbi:MAG: hypothetical protein PHR30_18530 [Gallionellaceae bacterium]|nr:hypothetical protein [Gallionellaceae bacterium]MDD5367335.1 hypothetical protein [Gallionellaceae bacterium]